MKKPLRWVLRILGALALAGGAVVWDANRRADLALRRHHETTLDEIALLRMRLSQRGNEVREWDLFKSALDILESKFDTPQKVALELLLRGLSTGPESLHAAIERNRAGQFIPYEDGMRAEGTSVVSLKHPLRDYSSQHLLLGLAVIQEITRGSGQAFIYGTLAAEKPFLKEWDRRMEEESLPGSAIIYFGDGLDRLKEGRMKVEDVFSVVSLLWRRELIRIARNEIEPDNSYDVAPDWRSLFLRKVHIVRLLNQAEEELKPVCGQSSFPTTTHLEMTMRALGHADQREKEWDRVRVRTALHAYWAETGSSPESFQDLVPRFLPRIPESLADGGGVLFRGRYYR